MQRLSLDGTWRLSWSDGQRGRPQHAELAAGSSIQAQVPGEVHLDLIRAGWIAEPTMGTNVLAARWVEECIWSYRRQFTVPQEALNQRAWLVFEGLDLVARIILNGQPVGTHNNSFHPCRIEVTGKLNPGDNVLVVHLDSGLFWAADKPAEGYCHLDWFDQKLTKRHWLRKPQCQFGWDWAPRLINVGIHKPVYLEWTDAQVRLDQLATTAELEEDPSAGVIRTRWFLHGLRDSSTMVRLQMEVEETGQAAETQVSAAPGVHAHELSLRLQNPKLWWPVGHGRQDRYTVRLTLRQGQRVLQRRTCRVGFRHVRFAQDPHPQGGRYFTLHVNGKPIFVKGSNFVPPDIIFARGDRHRYRELIDLALEANFNFLRVWGGGLYESDDFYDLCDEHGILVWQEFIFACARYPGHDATFVDSVRAEATYNIRRLASHPSLIAWCGNNELEWGTWDFGYAREGQVAPDYALFHHVLPRLLSEEDPTRYYQPSSPFSPDRQHPNRDDVGDQHPWAVGMMHNDFRNYRRMICRFPTEGGTTGPPSLPTLLACLPPGQEHRSSLAWQIHDNAVESWGAGGNLDAMLRDWLSLDVQKLGKELSLEDYVYFAGLLQGEALREYCDNFRRRMFDSSAAVFWMFNDSWPAVRSWTIIDYYRRRTPAFHPVRRALQPVHVVVAQENDQVCLFGINDTPESVRGELRFGIFRFAGEYLLDRAQSVALPPNASTRLASFPISRWSDPATSAAFATLAVGGQVVARNRLILPKFNEVRWAPGPVRVQRRNGHVSFLSDVFTWGVCLDLDGELPLADNFFDLFPGMAYTIPWPHEPPPRIVRTGNL